jgi:hypothetical protein
MFEDNFLRLVKIFKDEAKEWKMIGNGLVIVPKNAHFDVLAISIAPISFSPDFKWVFTAPVTIGYSGDVTKAYARLKSMECSVEVRGLLRREYRFVENPLRRLLFGGIPFDGRLAAALNEDEEVRALLGKASPDELHVACYYELLPGRSQVESMVEYFRNPTKLGWLVTASKGSYIEPVLPAAFKNMYRLLNTLALRLKTLTTELLHSGG